MKIIWVQFVCIIAAMLIASRFAWCQSATPLTVATAQSKVNEALAGDAVYAPLALGKNTLKIKFEDYAVITFGPRAIVSPAIAAGLRMAHPPSGYPRIWKDGAEAFGRNYGDALVSKVALQTARFGTSTLLHEDCRYKPSLSHNGFNRLFHAIAFTFVDRSDDGHPRLAISNFAGAAAGGFVGDSYLPDGFNSPTDGARRAARKFGSFAFNNVSREFSPEIFSVFHSLHLPLPHLPIPEWYTRDLSVANSGKRGVKPKVSTQAVTP